MVNNTETYEENADRLEEVTELGMCHIDTITEKDVTSGKNYDVSKIRNHSVMIADGIYAFLKTSGKVHTIQINYNVDNMDFVPKDKRETSMMMEMDFLKNLLEKAVGKELYRTQISGPIECRDHVGYMDSQNKLYTTISSPWY